MADYLCAGARMSRVVGCGSALPERRMTNHDIARMVDTTDEWITQRTGIVERRIAADGEHTSDLAIGAARAALGHAGIGGADVDLIVLATCTPDRTMPATAVRVQEAIGMRGGAAFDVQAVCSGFVFALSVADNMIRLGQARTAIVIGAETMSRIVDWQDRNTCVLFGDGAGAVVLRGDRSDGDTPRGVLTTHLHSDGRYHDKIHTDGGVSSTRDAGKMHLEGRDVFLHAVVNLAEASQEALASQGLKQDDVDWIVPHQANQRIVQTLGVKLNLPMEKVVVTVDRHGNTSAASIPLALAEAVADGRIKENDLVLTPAMGSGFTWGSALIRW
ncbi:MULTISPECIES: beta-ketoacyl-ACP synthase III [Burkholderia]|uniref:beta-ketoacyl-ACP synthase III n=1 Tax=Burkholderia TaxID=32008 RepID=UPI000F5208FE|nr:MULTISPECIES: beta-ketoacyl-ACP synthase III [Burkholderia]MBR8036348.1 ketoacyl-ACP synthase III [Burkholderia vietnamiensis]MBR8357456.1 ketoacyl-ACP synthase III [Burkholderia vietnamiensis]RQM54043.1 ketoacyl-ACP synthase III [Burkholderia vietnamiensis]CAG9204040.1 3-oxoacyl-(acyl-carrier-protein) synthase 3 [Burkholderia vietnamiensis]CAG9215159.1 3-oxoacyl-(acyl-carrier-protein) synthase 3 [Burkholderia vietnamiensis]